MSELLIYGSTHRGNKTLTYQGYKYLRHRTTTSSVIHWHCIKRPTQNCKSIMHTKEEKIVQHPGEHKCNQTKSNPNLPKNSSKVRNTQKVVQTQLEENAKSDQSTHPVENNPNSQLVQNELKSTTDVSKHTMILSKKGEDLEMRTVLNIKREMLTELENSDISRNTLENEEHPDDIFTEEPDTSVTMIMDHEVVRDRVEGAAWTPSLGEPMLTFSEKDGHLSQMHTVLNIKREMLTELENSDISRNTLGNEEHPDDIFTEEPDTSVTMIMDHEVVRDRVEGAAWTPSLGEPMLTFSKKDGHLAQMHTVLNIKQEMLIGQKTNQELRQEQLDIKGDDSQDDESIEELDEDDIFPPTPVSSRKRRRSIYSVDKDKLFKLRLHVAKLDKQIKEEELNLVRIKARNEEQYHEMRIKLMNNEFNNCYY
ncbi:uncharacterized protein LOC126264618 [Aethina tumida]|uniref:uncharacterized protein LOC126264618 n=1 Tax=Aethina tumida TaxID=116153 RepID=UPI0021482079|nr:uncharacterized protein LOC126264618 [Aethina tumida]